jgi:hypothetical protein
MGRNPDFRIIGSNPLSSASLAAVVCSLRNFVGNKPNIGSDF